MLGRFPSGSFATSGAVERLDANVRPLQFAAFPWLPVATY